MSNVQRLNVVSEPVHFLRKIRKILPTAIIAGGFYRDIYHNIPYSDVDIFIDPNLFIKPKPYGAFNLQRTAANFYEVYFWETMFNIQKNNDDNSFDYDYVEDITTESDEYEDNYIDGVFEIVHNEIKYNIILIPDIDPIKYIFDSFDFDLCKVYSDGTKISFSKEFMYDSKHKTISFTNRDVTFEFFCIAMTKHLKKLKRKYNTFRVHVPDKHFMHLANSKITI